MEKTQKSRSRVRKGENEREKNEREEKKKKKTVKRRGNKDGRKTALRTERKKCSI